MVAIPIDTYVDVPLTTTVRIRVRDVGDTTVPINTTLEVPINQTVVVPIDETLTVPIKMNLSLETTPEEIGLGKWVDRVIEMLEEMKAVIGG